MAESPTPNSRRSSTSTTSTVIYSQEPYNTFSLKVIQLLQGLYPDCNNIVVERMHGGGYNRIVGATLSSKEHIIIRISRFNDEIDDDVAILRYLEYLGSIPVPHILRYELTNNNPLESRYMIQKYIVGKSLQELMPALTLEKRLEIATELAEVIARMCTTTFERVGTLCVVSKDDASSIGFATPQNLEPFSNTLDFLLKCYETHTRNSQARDARSRWLPDYMEKLKKIACIVNTKRPFSNKFCLLHNDFMARNVLTTENANCRLGIAAILDWDGASAAPIEAAYVAPHWLWTWSPESEEGREEIADAMPSSADLRAVKKRFEEEIDLRIPGFMSIWREGSAARELFFFAINGLGYSHHAKRIDQLAQAELAPERAFPGVIDTSAGRTVRGGKVGSGNTGVEENTIDSAAAAILTGGADLSESISDPVALAQEAGKSDHKRLHTL